MRGLRDLMLLARIGALIPLVASLGLAPALIVGVAVTGAMALLAPVPEMFTGTRGTKVVAGILVGGAVVAMAYSTGNDESLVFFLPIVGAVVMLQRVHGLASPAVTSAILLLAYLDADVGLGAVSGRILIDTNLLVGGAVLALLVHLADQYIDVGIPIPSFGPPQRYSNPARTAPLAIAATGIIVATASFITFPDLSDSRSPISWDGGGLGALGGPRRDHPGLTGRLDAGDTPSLDDDVVLRVRSDLPLYWRGTTYDSYDGRFWRDQSHRKSFSFPSGGIALEEGANGDPPPGSVLVRQTYTLERSGLDVFLAAEQATALYYDAFTGTYGEHDGALRPDDRLPAGASWTVDSWVTTVSPESLRTSDRRGDIPADISEAYGSEDDVSAATIELAAAITADAATTYDKVIAIEEWFDDNVSYSRDVEPAPDGVDPVDELLFARRVGYCEQISSAMTVMLRSLGIPARIAVGYVPGEFDSSTNEWISRGTDAHAWTEVYFPGIGWQAFDPTSGVPLATAEAASPAADRSVPWALVAGLGSILALAAALAFIGQRSRRTSPIDPSVRRLDQIGALLELAWQPTDTLRTRLDDLERRGVEGDRLQPIRHQLEASAFGPGDGTQGLSAALDELEDVVTERRSELLAQAR